MHLHLTLRIGESVPFLACVDHGVSKGRVRLLIELNVPCECAHT
jgi:hypothetical protein